MAGELKVEAVGPYVALIAYARAAGAPNHYTAKAIVDGAITEHPDLAIPDLLPMIDGRAVTFRNPLTR